MHLLQRHICSRVFWSTIVALASAISVFATTQVLNEVNVLITSGEATLKSIELVGVAMPALIEILLPLAFLLGAIRVLATMNADSEIAVLESAGGGPSITAIPVYVLSALFALVILPLSLFVEPMANRASRGIIAEASISDFLAFTVRPGTFASFGDGLFIRIDDRLPGGGYGGLIFVDQRSTGPERIFYAKTATVAQAQGKDFLYLKDGVIQNGNATDNNLVSVNFASYAVDLSALAPKANDQNLQLKDRSTASLLFPAKDDPVLRIPQGFVAGELNRRFSDWLYAFAFASIALYFTGYARVGRNGRFSDIGVAILAALIVRGLGFVALSGSAHNAISAVLVYAVPLLTFAGFGWGSLLRSGSSPKSHREDRISFLLPGEKSLRASTDTGGKI